MERKVREEETIQWVGKEVNTCKWPRKYAYIDWEEVEYSEKKPINTLALRTIKKKWRASNWT